MSFHRDEKIVYNNRVYYPSKCILESPMTRYLRSIKREKRRKNKNLKCTRNLFSCNNLRKYSLCNDLKNIEKNYQY